MQDILNKLIADYPNISFVASGSLRWSADNNSISYRQDAKATTSLAGLLHEVGHARLGHTSFFSDMDLILKEREAWEEALVLAKRYNVAISSDYIEDCIDTYRDWIYKRSLCPACSVCSIQTNQKLYTCLNCGSSWKVSPSRKCRPYRLKQS